MSVSVNPVVQWIKPALLGLCLCSVSGCTALQYGAHVSKGHLSLLAQQRPLSEAVEDARLSPAQRQTLQALPAVVTFAEELLGLTPTGSYRHYVLTGRDAVTWSLVRTPEFSLTPRPQCFPVVGCVNYRGFFDQRYAERFAEQARAEGDDVDLRPVTAYSTLGWFDDPVLDTFMGLPEPWLVGLLVHELAHQRLYFPGNTVMSESFAMAVEREGVRRWLEQQGKTALLQRYLAHGDGIDRAMELMSDTRAQLQALYAREDLPEPAMRARKAELFQALRQMYRQKRDAGEIPALDLWFDKDLNNAGLSAVGDYFAALGDFEALLQALDHDMDKFLTQAEQIARQPPAQQHEALQALLRRLAAAGSDAS